MWWKTAVVCFKIFTVRLTKGLRRACLMEASFSVSAPDGARVQVLRTRFHLKNEFGNQSCWDPSFNRVCSVFQIVDQESKTEFNVFFFRSPFSSVVVEERLFPRNSGFARGVWGGISVALPHSFPLFLFCSSLLPAGEWVTKSNLQYKVSGLFH